MRVGIIGHYGVGLDLANGQTIKTRIITEAIEKKLNEKVYIVDAHGGVRAIIPVIIGCFKALRNCENVIIMLTENGLKVSVPILSILNKVFRKKLQYIVIGGWLEVFLNKNPLVEKQLKKFTKIYVETSTMLRALEKRDFSNVVVMPNCKELTILSDEDLIQQGSLPLRLCTFSRVMKEKGIEDLVNVIKEINSKSEVISLDIYGQIDAEQTEWFASLRETFPNYIQYGGVVSFDKSVEVLKQYYALVFPTKFFTEGIPGTIIDAYAAGIPVISAKWESFDDVVEDGVTGIGYTFGSTSELKSVLESCVADPNVLNKMKPACLHRAKDFTVDKAMQRLIDNL